MPVTPTALAALRDANLAFETDVPLAKRTYWRVGGPADALITASTVDQLAAVQRIASEHAVPVLPLGNASNMLVSDAGIRGFVVVLDGDLADAVEVDGALVAGAGMRLVALLARAKKYGWTGLEWAAGIPGTVGGAVRMNAGSVLGEAKDAIVDVTVVRTDGVVAVLGPDELRMTYRTTHLPAGAIVAQAHLRLTHADADASQARVKAFLDKRKATQPLDLPSCGSTFRNPAGDAAGRLIEASGLKGFAIGSAQVSEKHANFVVNLGGATANDIRAVIEHVAREVYAKNGVHLEQEVIYAGEW
jgi:UDP-N-acetylmuramate dehydrogenase